jgi:hypothetical protein
MMSFWGETTRTALSRDIGMNCTSSAPSPPSPDLKMRCSSWITVSGLAFCNGRMATVWSCIQSASNDMAVSMAASRSALLPRTRRRLRAVSARTEPGRVPKPSIRLTRVCAEVYRSGRMEIP